MDDERDAIIRAELEEDFVIDRYKVNKKIGAGAFGNIYSVFDIENNEKLYAMKTVEKSGQNDSNNCDDSSSQKSQTNHRKIIYDRMFENPDFIENDALYFLKDYNGIYFPEILAEGKFELEIRGKRVTFLYIIMTLFGPSLSLFKVLVRRKKFSPFTTTKVAIDMLNCIEIFHYNGYIHNDIKPANFLVHHNSQSPVVLIDFGLCIKYLTNTPNGTNHIPIEKNLGFIGTLKYASINAHKGILLSRRDDLFSWFYSILELGTGYLPWEKEGDYNISMKMKKNVNKYLNESIELELIPSEFSLIYQYISSLRFDENPNYEAIRGTLRKALREIAKTLKKTSSETNSDDYAYMRYDWEMIDKESIQVITSVDIDVPKPAYSYSLFSAEIDSANDFVGHEEAIDLNDLVEPGCKCVIN